MNIKRANKQDYLKFAAICCMIIDHIGLYFVPNHFLLRAIGRIAFPIFAFYAGYNFKDKLNYKILAHGITLCLLSIVLTKKFLVPNILISIFLGQLYLLLYNKYPILNISLFLQYIILLVMWPFTKKYFEYGSIAILIMLIGSLHKQQILSTFQSANQICLITILHSMIVFGKFFGNIDLVIWGIAMVSLWFALRSNINYLLPKMQWVRQISRNSLYIYSIHLACFMIISRY
ncbi:MAG: hypothetical protein H6909_03960 [Rickettsiaceae bacterium]|nr:hypothetical protein [Rickettsiaceae bacterium]